MRWQDKIIVKDIERFEDERGFFEVLADGEHVDVSRFGSLLVAAAVPGQVRGNHYHAENEDYAAIITGKALFVWEHVETGEREERILDGKKPQLIYVPPNVSHAMKNVGDELAILIEYSTMPFKEKVKDVKHHEVIPKD